MATFKPVIRSKRTDGTYLVYIRCTHNRKIEYIKTSHYIFSSQLKKNEIIDYDIIGKCAIKIKEWNERLNREDIDNWNVKDIIEFITQENTKISFSDYCRIFIEKMINEGRCKSASNYQCAVKSFELKFGQMVAFQSITSKMIQDWIGTLSSTARAKSAYPKAIKAIFEDGCLEYNDYDRNLIRIPNQPFRNVKIPKADVPEKRAVDASIIRKILEHKTTTKRSKLAQDVVKLMIYLVGINTVDLFYLSHNNTIKNKLCYNRRKTMHGRSDKAYIELSINPDVKYIFEKYKGVESLFDWGYKNEADFNKYVNMGLKKICSDLSIEPVDTYTFRHSWATIAQNKCGASTELVAFCLNHSSAHKVTEGYIEKDFTPIDKMNKKVLDYIFQRGDYEVKKEAD